MVIAFATVQFIKCFIIYNYLAVLRIIQEINLKI